MHRNEESAQKKPTHPDSLIGTVLSGRFRIVEWLGSGPMGNVYKAVQEPLGRLVAVKVLNTSAAAEEDEPFRLRFLREISLIAKLGHPNTVKVLDYGESDGVLYVAMEYLVGTTLADLLKDKRSFPWRAALHIAESVGRPLREAHRLGVIHRDLKPANIMLLNAEDFESVKVLDFGLVKPFVRVDRVGFQAEISGAHQAMVVASPEYMAPEQARNYADARSDIYALGIILYEMIAGVRPFSGTSFLELALQHTSEPIPRFATVRPEVTVPPRLESVIARCLEKDPANRFANLDELLDALKPLQIDTRGHTPPPLVEGIALDDLMTPEPLAAPAELPAVGMASFAREKRAPPRLVPPMAWAGASAVLLALLVWWIWPASKSTTQAALISAPSSPRPIQAVAAPAVQPAPEQPAPEVSTEVRFHVDSDPSGAIVTAGRRVLGQTPLTFSLPKGADGMATAELLLSLKGFQPLTVDIGGPGPEVVIKQKLEHAALRDPPRVVHYRQPVPTHLAPLEGSTVKLSAPRLVDVQAAPPQSTAPPVVATAIEPVGAGTPPRETQVRPPDTTTTLPKNVLPFVLDRDTIKRDPPRLSEVFKQTHRRGGVFNGMYRVCVATDGRVSSVTPVKSVDGADDEIIAGIKEGWLYRTQAMPVCALYPVPITVK